MSEDVNTAGRPGPAAETRRAADAALAAIVVAGLCCAAFVSWLGAGAQRKAGVADESFYFEPRTLKRASLAFEGLVADWYWMRTLQYVGRKIIAHEGPVALDDLGALGLDRLAPLLDATTTLDPQFMAAYEYGAVVLPAVDEGAAVRLLEKGLGDNPREWRLHHQLGYIHWQAGRYAEASAAYREGARQPGAPAWVEAMAAQMEAQGGNRQTAREIYRRMYEGAGDEQIRSMALKRLWQLDSLEERDAVRRVLAGHRSRFSRCPAAWREVSAALRLAGLRTNAAGSPVDPGGEPYALDAAACDVTLGVNTEIPAK